MCADIFVIAKIVLHIIFDCKYFSLSVLHTTKHIRHFIRLLTDSSRFQLFEVFGRSHDIEIKFENETEIDAAIRVFSSDYLYVSLWKQP